MPASKGGRWLTRDSQQTVISASPGRVYALVANLTRMGEWTPDCERAGRADGTAAAAEGGPFRRSQPGRAVPPAMTMPQSPRYARPR